MEVKKVTVSSKSGNGNTGTIVIRSRSSQKEVKVVMFSSSEAKILRDYIDKMKK